MQLSPERTPTVWDAAAAATAGIGVIAARIAHISVPRPTVFVTVCGLAAALVLLGRTRATLVTFGVVSALGLAPTLVAGTDPDLYSSFVPLLIAVYAVAAYCSPRHAAAVPVVAAVVIAGFRVRVPHFESASQFVFSVTGIVLAFAAGRTIRLLRHRADVEAARADLLDRERDVQAREAVLAERERISRELHDVIAHDVAVMIIQAGAAERLLPERRDEVAASLTQIQSSGRKAIDELHLLLGMLREGDQPMSAQPGLHSLGVLVDEVSRVGLPVALQVTGAVREVGEALTVSAYRLVQEALTNVLKHSAGSATNVSVDYGKADLTISVVDDGDGGGARRSELPSSGHGLVGMRERARIFGGTLAAGARPAGGWAVTAVLPIPAAPR